MAHDLAAAAQNQLAEPRPQGMGRMVMDVHWQLVTGKTISHYRILEKLGEGGMGVVYRAQDTRLNRALALKILSAEAVANSDRKKRFIQEARTASALNHPNVITVHDIDSSEGVDFIAMEYVEGKTLEELIGHRGLPLAEALRYAIEIADALAAAHDAGIVHRDLKPRNIMVTEKGRVKVLDFGLAKLTEAAGDAADESTATRSMTRVESPRTEDGMIVGTVAYMSPEQATGKKVDRRSDIFSFGSVLYEMVTAKRAFRGDKVTVLAAILQQDPQPASQLVPALPLELDRVIARCLRKDPERRFQHMDDVRVALQDLKEESESGQLLRPPEPAAARARIGPRLIVAGVVAGVILVGATAAATWWLSRPKPALLITNLARLTSDSGLTWEPALSADGKLIAYSSDRGGTSGPQRNLDIWVQQLSGGEPIRLTRDPADDREPEFSPDSSKIVFRSDREGGGIYVVPALGGEERLVAPNGQRPRFSPDGQWILYWVGNRNTGDPSAPGSAQAYVVSSTGGTPRQLHREFSVVRDPIWAPDGRRILFWGKLDPKGSIDWWVAPVDFGAAVATGAAAAFSGQNLSTYIRPAAWLPDGRVVFAAAHGDSSDLWALSIASGTWRAASSPVRITTGTGTADRPSIAVARDAGGRSVTRVAFSALTRDIQIWGLPFEANQGKVTGELRRLTQGPAAAEFGALSADGRKLVFSRNRAGDSDIWIKDLPSGRETDLTPTPARQFHPRMTADGSKISYSETKGSESSIYTMSIGVAADGSVRPGVPEKLCDGCRWAWQWSWDGTRVLYDARAGGRPYVMVANVASGEKAILLQHAQYNLYQANSSPDGRWVAFLAHTDAVHGRLFIVPFHAAAAAAAEGVPGDWIPVTSGQFWDDKPRWSPDGSSLYFISDRDGFVCFWGQRLDAATKRPVGPPFGIYHLHSASHSMTNVGLAALEPTVARNLLAFNVAEIAGNIWTATIGPQK